MRPGQEFRLHTATLAITSEHSHLRVPVIVPVGAVLTVLCNDVEDARFVSVDRHGQELLVFATDLLERGTHIKRDGGARPWPLR